MFIGDLGRSSVFDPAGLDIAWARRKRLAAPRDPQAPYVPLADQLCEMGRFGVVAPIGRNGIEQLLVAIKDGSDARIPADALRIQQSRSACALRLSMPPGAVRRAA